MKVLRKELRASLLISATQEEIADIHNSYKSAQPVELPTLQGAWHIHSFYSTLVKGKTLFHIEAIEKE